MASRSEREAMRAFRSSQVPTLVATSVTARGIDVRNVTHVINDDLPSIEYGGIKEYNRRLVRFHLLILGLLPSPL
jgi:superfamily II DNA/RNA helicase